MKKIIITGLPGSEKTMTLRRQIPYFIGSKDVRCLETQKGLHDIIMCDNKYERIVEFIGSYHDRIQEAMDDGIKMLIMEDHPRLLIKFFEQLVTDDQYRTLEQLIYKDPLFLYDSKTYYHFCDETTEYVLGYEDYETAFYETYRKYYRIFEDYENYLSRKKSGKYGKGKMAWELYL